MTGPEDIMTDLDKIREVYLARHRAREEYDRVFSKPSRIAGVDFRATLEAKYAADKELERVLREVFAE